MANSDYDDEADDLDFWRLCDELTIKEAALLVAGVSPAKNALVEGWEVHQRPRGYEAARSAILNGVRGSRIKGEVVPEMSCDLNGNEGPIDGTVSVLSRVDVESLREWLMTRGLRHGFFAPGRADLPDYLDTQSKRYAPKLAAAVKAWQAVTDAGNKHPKQALTKWLRENAAAFGLTDEDGKPNETGIEEIAKVANWQQSGGAPRTPGGQPGGGSTY